jgi:hypothetical protein
VGGRSTSPLGAGLPKRMPPLALCLAFIAGCTGDLPLTLSPDAPVEVNELGGSHYTVDPGSDVHRNLERWVTDNRSGWTHYYATLPGKGIIVRAGALDLQFLGSTVFAQTPQGAFHKSVAPADYGFLRRTANGT